MSVQTIAANKAKTQTIEISEIFETIQGEGPFMGTPALFIRTGTCNLACSWCDTPYTWKKGFTTYKTQTYESVFEQVASSRIPHIVVTGGEPMLHQPFIHELKKRFPERFIEIETNGTIPLTLTENIISHFNISPKLSNSGNTWYKLNLITPKSMFKFVVQSPEDLIEIETFLEQHAIPCERVYLMPEGTNRDTIQSRAKWLIPLCKEKKLHYTTRMHILNNIR